jgi:hypothetical protein
MLRNLLIQTDDDTIRFSEEFSDPLKLLSVVERMGLGGVVSKRRTSPYASGTKCGWSRSNLRCGTKRTETPGSSSIVAKRRPRPSYFLPAGSSSPAGV